MKKSVKILCGILAGVTVAGGGVAGGIALQNREIDQKVEAAREEGFQEGLTIQIEEEEKLPEYIDLSSIGSTGTIYSAGLDNGDFLISTSDVEGIWHYDFAQKSLSKVYENGKYEYMQVVQGGVLVCPTASETGVWFYDSLEKSFSQIYSDGSWNYIFGFGDGCLITSDSEYGILFYNNLENSIEEVYESGGYYSNFFELENVILISSKVSNYAGLLQFDKSTHVISKIHDSGYNFCYFHKVESGCLISGMSINSGLLYYDSTLNSITKIAEYEKWLNFYDVDDGVLITAGTYGVLFFDNALKTVSKMYGSGGFDIYKRVGDTVLLLSSDTVSSRSILAYKVLEHSITNIYNSNGGLFNIFLEIEGGLLMSASIGDGILYYDSETNSISKVISDGTNYTFTITENEVLCENEDYIYSFDPTTKKFTLKYDKTIFASEE